MASSGTLHSYQRNGLVTFAYNTPLGNSTDSQTIFGPSVVGDHGTFYLYVVTNTQLTVTVRFNNSVNSDVPNKTVSVIEPNFNPTVDEPDLENPIIADLICGDVFARQIEVSVQNTGVTPNTYFHLSGYFTQL